MRVCESLLGQRAAGGEHLSSFMKRFFSRSNSLALTAQTRTQHTMQSISLTDWKGTVKVLSTHSWTASPCLP